MARAAPWTPELDMMVAAVRREFDEMPGLALTASQAERLWALEPRACGVVLERLVQTGYLCRTERGLYARPSVA